MSINQQSMLLLPLLLLLLLPAQMVNCWDIVLNESRTFNCASLPGQTKDIRVTIAECGNKSHESSPEGMTNMIAVSVDENFAPGRVRVMRDYFNATSLDNEKYVAFHKNNRFVLKRVVIPDKQSSFGNITFQVRAISEINGLCFHCWRSDGQFFEPTSDIINVLTPPSASLFIKRQLDRERSEPVQNNNIVSVISKSNITIFCNATGSGSIDVRLQFLPAGQKQKETLRASGPQPSHKIISVDETVNAGIYSCSARSPHPELKKAGKDESTARFTLDVQFAPKFNVEELEQYAMVDEKKTIKITVQSNPSSSLTCSDTAVRKVSYEKEASSSIYSIDVTLTKDKIDREFTCNASNSIGSTQFILKVTAKAPVPRIVSNAISDSHNSYGLSWEHHKEANVDRYVVHLSQGQANITRSENKSMAEVKKSESSASVVAVHRVTLYKLNPNQHHNVTVQACNEHGCSDHSKPVLVKTLEKKALTNPSSKIGNDCSHLTSSAITALLGTALMSLIHSLTQC